MLAEYYRKWPNKGRGVYLILGIQAGASDRWEVF